MTLPPLWASSTFIDPEDLDSNKIYTRILQPGNQIIQWARTVPALSSPSGVVLGTFDPTKPVARAVGYVESTTDGSGNKIVATFPAGTTAVLAVDITPVFRVSPQVLGPVIQMRLDASSIATGVVFQWRQLVTSPSVSMAIVASGSIAYCYDVLYQ